MEKAPGSDPSGAHNVTLVGFKTKPDSEKVNATAPTPAPVDTDDRVNVGRPPIVEIQGGMKIRVEEMDLQEIGQDHHGENPWKDQAKDAMKELDPLLRRLLENDTELGASQGANSSAAHFPAPTVPNESGDVEGDIPDSNTERYVAIEDAASARIDVRSEGWDEWQLGP